MTPLIKYFALYDTAVWFCLSLEFLALLHKLCSRSKSSSSFVMSCQKVVIFKQILAQYVYCIHFIFCNSHSMFTG